MDVWRQWGYGCVAGNLTKTTYPTKNQQIIS